MLDGLPNPIHVFCNCLKNVYEVGQQPHHLRWNRRGKPARPETIFPHFWKRGYSDFQSTTHYTRRSCWPRTDNIATSMRMESSYREGFLKAQRKFFMRGGLTIHSFEISEYFVRAEQNAPITVESRHKRVLGRRNIWQVMDDQWAFFRRILFSWLLVRRKAIWDMISHALASPHYKPKTNALQGDKTRTTDIHF